MNSDIQLIQSRTRKLASGRVIYVVKSLEDKDNFVNALAKTFEGNVGAYIDRIELVQGSEE